MRRRLVLFVLPLLALLLGAGPTGAQTNDPGLGYQWGLTQIGGPTAWAKSTGAGMQIGVVDTGIDLNHSDLKNKVVASTTCITTQDKETKGDPNNCAGNGQDDHGHGTHVAGIAAAAKGNGHGIAGVAPDAQLIVAKVLDSAGAGSEDDVLAGVRWVLSKGADVVNLSLGDPGLFGSNLLCSNTRYKALLNEIWNAGAVPVFAAGNCGGGLLGGGADFADTNALIVGATNIQGNKTSYTNDLYSAKWGLVAPGGEPSCDQGLKQDNPCIFSTFWDSTRAVASDAYAYMAGTSMAAPHVAGAVAALRAQGLSKQQAVERIMATLSKGPCGDGCQGRLDLANAVGSGTAPGPPPTTTPTTKKTGGSTATTRRPSTATTRRPSSSPATTIDLSETPLATVPDTTEPTVVDEDELELAEEPFQGGDDGRPGDEGVNGPLAVLATLGLLGAGGTAAPIAWRFFRGAGGP